jgi:hypothetical protein
MSNAVSSTPTSVGAYGPPVATSGDPFTQGLSPDALLVYLSTRLGSLEDQINGYFVEQQRADRLRSLINDMKNAINSLNVPGDAGDEAREIPTSVANALETALDEIGAIDPGLATRLLDDLQRDGFVGAGQDLQYHRSELEPSLEYLDNAIGDLNSTSQLNMIHLQSLVRAHETAVSLGTNLVEAAGRTTQKIADRIGG